MTAPLAPPPPSLDPQLDRWMRLMWAKIQGALSSTWALLDFTGSNLTSIATRNHNDLQSLQGGAASQYYHLTATEYSVLGDAVAHDDLVNVQGGLATVFQTNAFQLNAFQQAEEYHLTSAQHAEAIAARSSRGVLTVDDLIVDLATKGLVLKDTQGTPHYWRVTISNVGAIVTTDVGTSAP